MTLRERLGAVAIALFGLTVKKAESEKAPDPKGFAFDIDRLLLLQPGGKSGLVKPTRVSFNTLRVMRRSNAIIRLCIDTLKHQVSRANWDIVSINEKVDIIRYVEQTDRIKTLLKKPNENNETFRTLLEKTMEDILTLDQADWEIIRNMKGEIVEIYALDGATIRPVYDRHGQFQEPAYLQYLPGKYDLTKPDAEFQLTDIIHMMQNPQTDTRLFGYGFSPIEAIIATATNYLNADMHQGNVIEDGTFTNKILNLGEDASTEQVKRFREYWKTEIEGKATALPIIGGTKAPQVIELGVTPKDAQFMEYVQWLARITVGAFGLSPQDIGLNLDQYKAEGEIQANLSHKKGYLSLLDTLAEYINQEVIWEGFGSIDPTYRDIKFEWINVELPDEKKRAEVAKMEIGTGAKTVNEYRKELGLDAYTGFGDRPFIITGSGPIYLDQAVEDQQKQEENEEKLVEKSVNEVVQDEIKKITDKISTITKNPVQKAINEQPTFLEANNPVNDDNFPGRFSYLDDDKLRHPFGREYAYLTVGERITPQQYASAQALFKQAAELAYQFLQPSQVEEQTGLRNESMSMNLKEVIDRVNAKVQKNSLAIVGVVNHFQKSLGHYIEPVYVVYELDSQKITQEELSFRKVQRIYDMRHSSLEKLVKNYQQFFERRIRAMKSELDDLVPTITTKNADTILNEIGTLVSDDEIDPKIEKEDEDLLKSAALIGLGIGLYGLLKNSPAMRREAIETAAKSVTTESMETILRERALLMAKSIHWTMKNGARQLIARMVSEGASTEKITKALNSYLDTAPWRAERIARTETAWAANQASSKQALSSGAIKKRWQTVGGGDQSEICRENEGQGWIPMNQSFFSGNAIAPSHPNCLCHIEYGFEE